MPIVLSQASHAPVHDEFKHQEICYCERCSCVQLKTLVEPSKLYAYSHNTTHATPTWNQHHKQFCEFITESGPIEKVMEIGGSSGVLYQHLQSKNIGYSCIDICPPTFNTSQCEYIIGNAEEYNFKNVNCIVMSHVFEHLYEPKQLIRNLSDNNIQTIYLSIPNMVALLNNRSSSIIHYEHTYYVDKYLVEYLFSEQGYSLTKYSEFKDHSLFMQFSKTKCNIVPLISRPHIVQNIYDIYRDMSERFTKMKFMPNSYIIPAGHMGQLIYTILKPNNMYGFLDNDPSKQNKRQYGTPYTIYSFDKLNELNSSTYVYIYAGPYTKEIVEQLKKYSYAIPVIL